MSPSNSPSWPRWLTGGVFHLWRLQNSSLQKYKSYRLNPVFYVTKTSRLSRLFFISHILTKPKAVCDQLLSSTTHQLLCIQMLQSGDRRMVLPDGKRRFRHMICASWCHRTHCLRRSRVCVNGIKQAHESYRNRSVSGSTILLISVKYHFYIQLLEKN